ncbi:Protein of unknown function [Pyronema omphalodes CBS 100304]|uniref:Uncharacterized protein n=1 Tax=Pyronema omphalodes (strain CBS 100304) TaxID=1076935 RepID=U4KVK4_PYROM|nr:Protein of unknown function [Pyronema omphalodes CBS 100304]
MYPSTHTVSSAYLILSCSQRERCNLPREDRILELKKRKARHGSFPWDSQQL